MTKCPPWYLWYLMVMIGCYLSSIRVRQVRLMHFLFCCVWRRREGLQTRRKKNNTPLQVLLPSRHGRKVTNHKKELTLFHTITHTYLRAPIHEHHLLTQCNTTTDTDFKSSRCYGDLPRYTPSSVYFVFLVRANPGGTTLPGQRQTRYTKTFHKRKRGKKLE